MTPRPSAASGNRVWAASAHHDLMDFTEYRYIAVIW